MEQQPVDIEFVGTSSMGSVVLRQAVRLPDVPERSICGCKCEREHQLLKEIQLSNTG